MNRKILFPILGLALAIMACNVQINTTNPPPAASTETPTATVPALSLSVVPSPELIRIDFQDASNGWGVGSTAILRSQDGGVTWLNATPPGTTITGYSTVLFVLDTDHAWVLLPGADFLTGTLYRTSDGGAAWTSNPVPFAGGVLQFLDTSVGRVLADRGAGAGSNAVELYQTSDGGATWTSVFHNDPTQPGSSDSLPLGGIKNGMTFRDASTGWVTGSRPMDGDVYLYITHDGGVSWAQQGIPLPAGYEAYQYMPQAPIFFGQDSFLPLSVYMTNIYQTFYTTHDGGATWSGDPSDAYTTMNAGLYSFPDAQHGWSWNGGTNLVFTTDGAQSWTGTGPSLDLTDRLAQLDFVSSGTGWALTSPDSGGHSQLYQTSDNGSTWITLIP